METVFYKYSGNSEPEVPQQNPFKIFLTAIWILLAIVLTLIIFK